MRAALLLLALAGAVPVAAAEPVPVPVLIRAVPRGEIVSAADFELQPRSPGMAVGVLRPADAEGREAVRDLTAGAVVRPADLVTPRLVRRGEPVTIALRAGGLVITTAGRALSSGGLGEPVRVVATTTNRTFDGVVEAGGAVRIRAQ